MLAGGDDQSDRSRIPMTKVKGLEVMVARGLGHRRGTVVSAVLMDVEVRGERHGRCCLVLTD